jgi:hypothetical protein
VTNKGHKDAGLELYKLKDTTGKLCARKALYTAEQLEFIDSELRDYMHFFGYASHPTIESPY